VQRDTEKQVERLEQWIDRPKPQISDKGLQLANKPNNAHDRPMWLDVMLELTYLAFLTDTTRVVTFEWSKEAGGKGGEHSPKNLPLLEAGGRHLGLKLGQHLAFDSDKHPPMSNLLLTLAQRVGVQTDAFSDSTGTLDGLV
jgi:hypothetical protein